jgi:RNA polymerase sigma-70 factor, ECF subfamily
MSVKLVRKALKNAVKSPSEKSIKVFRKNLYEAFFDKVYLLSRYYSKESCDDLTAEIFIKLFKISIDVLIEKEEYLTYFILKVAKNYLLNYVSKQKKNRTESMESNIEIIELNNYSKNLYDQDTPDINNAISKLNDSDRKIVTFVLEGYSYKEISIQLNTSENAIKKKMERIRNKLRKLLSDK